MKSTHYMKTIFLFIVVAVLVGCGPKKEKPGESAAPGQEKGGVTAADTKDKADASSAGSRVYSLMQSSDFSTVYKESAPAFKKSGSEPQFVSAMKELQQKTGALKNMKLVGYNTADNKELGKIYSVTFDLQFDKAKQTQIVTFVRSSNGKMEITGLHQVKK